MKMLLQNTQLIDGTGKQPIINTDILIKDGIISEIKQNINSDEIDQIIDIKGKTVMPGMIDAHLHLIGIRS